MVPACKNFFVINVVEIPSFYVRWGKVSKRMDEHYFFMLRKLE